MTPHEFITKWRASELKERSASQEHFIDLFRLLDEPTPAEADPTGERYCFERGARGDSGRDGCADVWKRHHFAWEYKGSGRTLTRPSTSSGSTTDVMLAGNWKTSRMVAHYSAGATAECGAVAR